MEGGLASATGSDGHNITATANVGDVGSPRGLPVSQFTYQVEEVTKPPRYDAAHHSRMLLLAKAVYFCIFAADASWEPFAAYVLSRRGMNNAVIGGLLTAMTVCNAVSGQLLTAFADRYSCHRNVALTSFTLFVIFTCSLVFSNHFAYTAGVGILAQCAWGPVLPMTDNVTVQLVRDAQREDYSRQRLFAAIAWALFCFGDG